MRSHSHDVLHVEEADDDAVPLQDDHAPIGGQGSAKDKFYGTPLSVWQIYEKAQKLKVSLRATALHSDDSATLGGTGKERSWRCIFNNHVTLSVRLVVWQL